MKTEFPKTKRNDLLKGIFKGLAKEVQSCLQDCIECHQGCEQLIQYCLEKGGKHAEPGLIRLLQDCTEITAIAANFMMRESAFHGQLCKVTADVCQACADMCDSVNDEALAACATLCRQCADACEGAAVHH